MRVLYVDDDRINTLLFVETCRRAEGLEVETAASGAEALEQVLAWAPDLLVIDLHLPDTTGFELLPSLRTTVPTLDGVPAFLCTADDIADVHESALAAGFAGCWQKPMPLASLLAELAALGHRTRP